MTSSPGRTIVPAPALVIAAIVSVQLGGALAVTLIPTIGASGSVTLRLAMAAVIMALVARPRLGGHGRRDWLVVSAFGVVLATMNLFFYASLAHLPIGVSVTLEFIGPLTLAAVLSHHARDLLMVGGAGLGVVLISGALNTPWAQLDLLGIVLALGAGTCWAAYILLSGRTGQRFPQLDGLAIALVIGAVLVTPLGLIEAGTRLWSPDALWRGIGIAVLSSVLPYSLELVALRRLAANIFGILLSLEPAVAALAGLVVLGQRLDVVQLCGMALVVAASALVMGRRKHGGTTEQMAETTNQ